MNVFIRSKEPEGVGIQEVQANECFQLLGADPKDVYLALAPSDLLNRVPQYHAQLRAVNLRTAGVVSFGESARCIRVQAVEVYVTL